MSTRCYNCHRVPTRMATTEKLMKFLNKMRTDYLAYLQSRITPDAAKWAIRYTEEFLKKKRGAHDFDNLDIGDEMYYRQFLLKQAAGFERGMPWDCSGNCVVVQHMGIIVLWFFPGCEMDTFMRNYAPLKKFTDYSWSNQCDPFPWRITKFWESLFDERGESIPSNLGLCFDFWRENDAWGLARKFEEVYTTLPDGATTK